MPVSMPVFVEASALSSPSVVASSNPNSLAEEAPSPHVIFRLRGIAREKLFSTPQPPLPSSNAARAHGF